MYHLMNYFSSPLYFWLIIITLLQLFLLYLYYVNQSMKLFFNSECVL